MKFIPYAAVIAALVLLYTLGWTRGADSVREAWQAEREAQLSEIARLSDELGKATDQVVTEYVDRVRIVREKGQTIIKEVPVYVPSDSCDLPGGFRVLHDAAASGELPEPARVADALPVGAADAAGTITTNYAACHENAEQLIALQNWIRSFQLTTVTHE